MKAIKFAFFVAIMALFPSMAGATDGAAGGLSGTAHDFTLAGGHTFDSVTVPPTGLTDVGLCTFCHTPHKAYSTALLWNHTLSSNNFSWTDADATTAGTKFATFGGSSYKGPTAKCLSCHDGSVAIGDIAWYAEGSRTGTNNLNATRHNTPNDPMNVGLSGSMNGNHPVAMPYPLGSTPNLYNNTTTGANINFGEWQNPPMGKVKLYQDNGGVITIADGTSAGKAGIECTSCHDPHNKQTDDDWFLRGKVTGNTQSGGYICLQCHIK